MIEKLLIRKGENDTNGNNLYEENEKEDKLEKVFMGNSVTFLKDSLTKPYVKNKKNNNVDKSFNKDYEYYGKKIQKNNDKCLRKKIYYPKIGFRIVNKIQLYKPFSKRDYLNLIDYNNSNLNNGIYDANNQIKIINKKLFNVFAKGKNIFESESVKNNL